MKIAKFTATGKKLWAETSWPNRNRRGGWALLTLGPGPVRWMRRGRPRRGVLGLARVGCGQHDCTRHSAPLDAGERRGRSTGKKRMQRGLERQRAPRKAGEVQTVRIRLTGAGSRQRRRGWSSGAAASARVLLIVAEENRRSDGPAATGAMLERKQAWRSGTWPGGGLELLVASMALSCGNRENGRC
uniref:Uncharacterized protein n=1 Tax=Triticum urartu TaxID=4572 RepID=A0A8R7P387_TRIUA